MPKLVTNSAAPALEAEAQAHHYKLIGIEITNVGGGLITQELVLLGARSSGCCISFAQQPHHITFDRCWIHEATNDKTTPNNILTTAIRGFNLNATDITITESRIAGFRAYQSVAQGVEASNAILFPNSALRVTVQNNRLESWFARFSLEARAAKHPILPRSVIQLSIHPRIPDRQSFLLFQI